MNEAETNHKYVFKRLTVKRSYSTIKKRLSVLITDDADGNGYQVTFKLFFNESVAQGDTIFNILSS